MPFLIVYGKRSVGGSGFDRKMKLNVFWNNLFSTKKSLKRVAIRIRNKYPLAFENYLSRNHISIETANTKALRIIAQRTECLWRREENKLQQEEEKRKKVEEQQLREKKLEEQKEREQKEREKASMKITENTQEEQTKVISPEEKQRLINLSESRKNNWKEFQRVLTNNNIRCFYHFTDRSNLQSIRNLGGLFSWYYCYEHCINIPRPGGSDSSWKIDYKKGLQDYVRLSFTPNHPMMYVAKNEGRIIDPVILQIDLDVAYIDTTLFSDINAATLKTPVHIGDELDNLSQIHFSTVKLPNHFDLNDVERPFYQAEILVKTFVPMKYIHEVNPIGFMRGGTAMQILFQRNMQVLSKKYH